MNPRVFSISAGDVKETIAGRRAAVSRAKELSRKRRSTVNVERADSAEVLTFRGGSLDQYVFSTRGRR